MYWWICEPNGHILDIARGNTQRDAVVDYCLYRHGPDYTVDDMNQYIARTTEEIPRNYQP